MVEEEEAVVDAVVAVALLDLHIRFALGLGPTMGSGRSTRPPAANHLCLAVSISSGSGRGRVMIKLAPFFLSAVDDGWVEGRGGGQRRRRRKRLAVASQKKVKHPTP
jgi:hypothetical protein